jgi:hypothetical protein
MFYVIFSSISFVGKNNWKKDSILHFWVEGKIIIIASFYFLKLLCKKYTYNINHYVGTINLYMIFFHVGHCIVNA